MGLQALGSWDTPPLPMGTSAPMQTLLVRVGGIPEGCPASCQLVAWLPALFTGLLASQNPSQGTGLQMEESRSV